ncbi:LOW QUALITY PROTEIN: uncharacterized protein si:ch73-52p7.1, partial [Coregonus clupeaformis]|uniref:LOW QUALITY PROTEIN: uncharacterized protein si:ch73-52p7.1 n=1 Tax=Coregonus clupeaformis TaxID=59861 RepID=UPI001E1C40DD
EPGFEPGSLVAQLALRCSALEPCHSGVQSRLLCCVRASLETSALRHLGQALLSCLILMAVSGLLRPEFKLAHVTDHSLLYCACVHELVACGVISPREYTCKDHSLSLLHRSDSSSSVQIRRLTIWYTSPLNVSLLLNNSEVWHLTLIKCNSVGSKQASLGSFTVQHLQRLTVSYPLRRSGQTHGIIPGRDMCAPYYEEARLGIIHSSVLLGESNVKAYTVQTNIDRNGILSSCLK